MVVTMMVVVVFHDRNVIMINLMVIRSFSGRNSTHVLQNKYTNGSLEMDKFCF